MKTMRNKIFTNISKKDLLQIRKEFKKSNNSALCVGSILFSQLFGDNYKELISKATEFLKETNNIDFVAGPDYLFEAKTLVNGLPTDDDFVEYRKIRLQFLDWLINFKS